MSRTIIVAVLSDIHYASAAEQARGKDFEFCAITNPLLRWALKTHRHYLWLRDPLGQNGQLDRFLAEVGDVDFVVANGDYSCNTGFIGLGDDAAFQSAKECLDRLRQKFGEKLLASIGDHELGKLSFVGARGGMRLASWRRTTGELGLKPFWRQEIGNYVLMSVTSSLVELPVFTPDMLPEEKPEWEKLREQHLAEIRVAFDQLKPDQLVIFFCHDPTALPFLWREDSVRRKLGQIEQTIIGHLHSNLIFWKSKILAGMPVIRFMGHTAKRMSSGLHEARHWRPFHVRLCPSLAGIELLKDGGYLVLKLDPEARRPVDCRFRRLKR